MGTIPRLLEQRHAVAGQALKTKACHVEGVTFCDQAFLSCLGSERRCALIVHVGDTFTQVVPVVRSQDEDDPVPEPLLYCAQKSATAGNTMTRLLAASLAGQEARFEAITCEPLASEKSQLLVRDVKEACSYAALDFNADLQSCSQSKALEDTYDLPDGDTLQLGWQRFVCSEPLFSHGAASALSEATLRSALGGVPDALLQELKQLTEEPTLPELIAAAIEAAPPAWHSELWSNIVLSGGPTLLPNFAPRLRRELQALFPDRARLMDIIVLKERAHLPWIGGSILAEMETRASLASTFVSQKQWDALEARTAVTSERRQSWSALSMQHATRETDLLEAYAIDMRHLAELGA